jgi:uncharacterized protein
LLHRLVVTQYHESVEQLRAETREMHRALRSLIEELEAIDWYAQRIDASDDAELAAVLTHNRDEEKEHASLLAGWLAARDAVFAAEMTEKLASRGRIDEEPKPRADGSLGIGSLRGRA